MIADTPKYSDRFGPVLQFDERELKGTVLDRFGLVVERFPDNTAIYTETLSFTYKKLDEEANCIAQAISEVYGVAGVPVAILMGHGALPIVALLGALKSGNSYVMLDVMNPTSWLHEVLQDSRAQLVVTDTQHLLLASELAPGHQLLNIDEALVQLPSTNKQWAVTADTPLAIYYTSGSTGKPKGVILTQRYLLHYVWANNQTYQTTAGDRLTVFFSYSFAASLPNIFEALFNGASLYPLNIRSHTATQLSDWLAQQKITICRPPVSLFRQLIDPLEEVKQALSLRIMILGGQTMTQADIDAFQELFPTGCGLLNRLSSTETGLVACAFVENQQAGDRTPVGYPVAGKTVLLLDENGRAVPQGETGEIVIKSRYLAAGYWRQPASVQAKFLPDPDDESSQIYLTGDLGRLDAAGQLYHYGRKDFLVKIRGYRVELRAVEQALQQLSSVKDAAVIADNSSDRDPRLLAYVIPTSHPPATQSALRSELQESLPHYMIPSQFVIMEAFPQTVSGKIDRQALPQPGYARPELATAYVAPQSPLEEELVRIWESIFHVSPIGIQDDFFELGGHSLLALRLSAQLEEKFKGQFNMQSFLHHPTIAHLAQMLASEQETGVSFPVVKQLALRERIRQNGARLLPYPILAKGLAWFYGQPFLWRSMLRQDTVFLRRAFSEFVAPEDIEKAIHHSLICHYRQKSRCASLGQHLQHHFDEWVEIRGAAHFEEAYRLGRGVILVKSHVDPALLSPTVLFPYLQDKDLSYVGILQDTFGERGEAELNMGLGRLWAYTFQLDQTRQTLAQGGVAVLAADGHEGAGQAITLPFLGRLRPFKLGFAELSIATGAPVIPVHPKMNIEGKVTITFSTPLPEAPPEASHEERLNMLVQGFVAQLHQWWRLEPGTINWLHLKRFLKKPSV